MASNVCSDPENDRPQDLYTIILKEVIKELEAKDQSDITVSESLRIVTG